MKVVVLEEKFLDNVPVCIKRGTKKRYVLLSDIEIVLTSSDVIVIHKGFQFDGRSTPLLLTPFMPSVSDAFLAYLLHDWLYATDYMYNKYGYKISKLFADQQMLNLAGQLESRNYDNKISFWAVRIFGGSVYKKRENG